ncbi:hypothetical protein P691DRAFT_774957 [Macrolepiota fuliginosa MF-IS2]|uniref:DUF6533 domain-containing protein n=1 Tax=Macrolepiota fuliginosa MF-IS2 TaxID=1400762 RepID=A0A9P6C556_9AGAR|nr:hypothetical protein P691DRAFT_774957 [Macrolepiota fuliginosa MF-IS2]
MAQLPSPTTIAQIYASRYTYVAAEFLMIWDILLKFDDEVKYVWSSRWTVGKILYLINRYLTPILFIFDLWYLLTSNTDISLYVTRGPPCKRLYIGPSVLAIVACLIIECTLILRVHALYGSRTIFLLLTMLCFASMGTMMGTTLRWYLFDFHWFTDREISVVIPGCLVVCQGPLCKPLTVLFWVPFFVFEIAVLILIILDTWRNRAVMRSCHQYGLAAIICRDGIIYYMIMTVISMSNLFIWALAPDVLKYFGSSLIRSIQSIACSRLMLNIWSTVDSTRGFRSSGNFDSFSFSGRRFSGTVSYIRETTIASIRTSTPVVDDHY